MENLKEVLLEVLNKKFINHKGLSKLADVLSSMLHKNKEDVMQALTDTFVVMYGEQLLLVASWEEYQYQTAHIVINYRVMKHTPKKMTVAEIEKKLGYKIEIVSDK